MATQTVWLIELQIDGKIGYFTGAIGHNLMPQYTTSPFHAKEYPSKASADFAKFYYSLHGSSVEEHSFS